MYAEWLSPLSLPPQKNQKKDTQKRKKEIPTTQSACRANEGDDKAFI